jgi:hypothetical protein
MEHGAWRATCGCGWRSGPSVDMDAQTGELDGHLRGVVTAEQRPGRVERVVTASVVQLVDHTVAVGLVTSCLALAAPLLVRRRVA